MTFLETLSMSMKPCLSTKRSCADSLVLMTAMGVKSQLNLLLKNQGNLGNRALLAPLPLLCLPSSNSIETKFSVLKKDTGLRVGATLSSILKLTLVTELIWAL
jgi:hypothetical protein